MCEMTSTVDVKQIPFCFVFFCAIAYSYHVGHSTVCSIVAEIAREIWDYPVKEYIPDDNRKSENYF